MAYYQTSLICVPSGVSEDMYVFGHCLLSNLTQTPSTDWMLQQTHESRRGPHCSNTTTASNHLCTSVAWPTIKPRSFVFREVLAKPCMCFGKAYYQTSLIPSSGVSESVHILVNNPADAQFSKICLWNRKNQEIKRLSEFERFKQG